ncbi:MAG TPA: hypothetical protein VGI61_12330 [Parafilimonas sp.]|jgi:hypothetical protein
MQNAGQINLLDQKYYQLKNVNNSNVPALKKVSEIEKQDSDNGFTLLKRFLKELQLADNNFLKMYNREII